MKHVSPTQTSLSPKKKRLIALVALLQIVLIALLISAPKIVNAIPGEYRVRIAARSQTAQNIIEHFVVQVPDTLSAPETNPSGTTVTADDIPVLPGLDSTATPVPATATAEPTKEAPADETDDGSDEEEDDPVATDTPAPTATPIPTAEPIPISLKLEGVSVEPQKFNNCGPANLSLVLQYYGDDTTQEEAAAYLKPNREDRNVSPWQLSDYVNEFTDLRSTVHTNGTIDMLKQLIAAGYPVVIEKGYEPNNGTSSGWYGHYLTVFGYDDEKQEIYSQDTYLGPWDGSGRVDSYEEIDHYWRHFNYTFYVLFPPEDEAIVMAMIPAELHEPLSMWEATAARAQAEIEADPEDSFSWLNFGAASTRLGEILGDAAYYEAGAQAIDTARSLGLPPRTLWYEHRPFMAYWKTGRLDDVVQLSNELLKTQGGQNVEEIYWYRGHALLALGDIWGAKRAYQDALRVNENFYPAQVSLDYAETLD